MYVYLLRNSLTHEALVLGRCTTLSSIDKLLSQARSGLGGSVASRVAIRTAWEQGAQIERELIYAESLDVALRILEQLRREYHFPSPARWTHNTIVRRTE